MHAVHIDKVAKRS